MAIDISRVRMVRNGQPWRVVRVGQTRIVGLYQNPEGDWQQAAWSCKGKSPLGEQFDLIESADDGAGEAGWPEPLNIPDTPENRARGQRGLEYLTGGAASIATAEPGLSAIAKSELLRLLDAEERDCMRAPMGVLRAEYQGVMRGVREELERLP